MIWPTNIYFLKPLTKSELIEEWSTLHMPEKILAKLLITFVLSLKVAYVLKNLILKAIFWLGLLTMLKRMNACKFQGKQM